MLKKQFTGFASPEPMGDARSYLATEKTTSTLGRVGRTHGQGQDLHMDTLPLLMCPIIMRGSKHSPSFTQTPSWLREVGPEKNHEERIFPSKTLK